MTYETEVIRALDRASTSCDDFERLACAAESGARSDLGEALNTQYTASGLASLVASWEDDFDPLCGLEIGVAGLTYALSATGFITAASCRWHMNDRSWSDCPVVFFAAPGWRTQVLADLLPAARCGLDADRDMLKICGASVLDMNKLASALLEERSLFRRAQQSDERT